VVRGRSRLVSRCVLLLRGVGRMMNGLIRCWLGMLYLLRSVRLWVGLRALVRMNRRVLWWCCMGSVRLGVGL